jgi:hypothetical protein
LVCDELEGLPHGVLDHFLLGLFGFFESFVKILENLGHKSLAGILHKLFCPYDSILLDVDSGYEKVDHVTKDSEYFTLW